MTLLKNVVDAGEFATTNFTITNLQDEVRVDQLVPRLLRIYYQWLVNEEGLAPLTAGEKTRGVDYFLREFIVAECRENIFLPRPERVRQFAGHWYIIRNIEPNIAELSQILSGVQGFYRFLAAARRLEPTLLEEIVSRCSQTDYYQQRIDDFWAIEGDGYLAWCEGCPLPFPGGSQ